MHDPFAPFRSRGYGLLTAQTLLTNLVQHAQTVAVGWDLYERTGSALALGVLGLIQFAPVILLFLPAGEIADRFDRRHVVVLGLAIWGAANLLLAWTAASAAPVEWIYVAAAATGAAQVINRPSRDALLAQLLPRAAIGSGVAWSTSLFQLSAIAAPVFAGAVIAASGAATPVYALNAALTTAACVTGLLIQARRAERMRQSRSLGELFGGLTHVWRTKEILAVITLDLATVIFSTATALLPIYAKDILQVGPAGLGWLTASRALGAFGMSLLQNLRRPFRRAGSAFVASLAGYGLAIVVFGLSTWFWLSLAALIAVGALDNVNVVIRQTIVQLYTPDELRGRVSAVNRVFISSSNELGAFEAGLVASLAGPVFTMVLGGVATLLFVAWGLRFFPGLRHIGSLEH